MNSKNNKGDAEVFRQAMTGVTPLRPTDRIDPEPAGTPAKAFQRERDDREAFKELMDFTCPEDIETGEELLWLKPGYPQRIIRRLRRGHYSVGDTIDLHHMDVETAKAVLLDFIEHALRGKQGCIKVIHGKGLRSKDIPRLKVLTNRVLYKHPNVIAYASCRAVDGGTGATMALLTATRGAR